MGGLSDIFKKRFIAKLVGEFFYKIWEDSKGEGSKNG